jgi:transposase
MATIYQHKSRLSPRPQSKLIELFVAGSTACAAAEIVGVQPNTAIRFFMRLRQLLASKLPSYQLCGEGEADESDFGGVRKGKRGRGTASKGSYRAFAHKPVDRETNDTGCCLTGHEDRWPHTDS